MVPFRLTPVSRQANSSPSVTLEKGAYRMHAPPARLSPVARRGSQTRSPDYSTTYMALLVVLLASACLSCFGAAYYLFNTRWDTRSPRDSQADENIQVVPSDPDPNLYAFQYPHDPHEKFLAYLPHSGFHNQRIAFENALVLSRLLNRTLLVPPIRLGDKPIRYVKFDVLQQFLALSSKEGLHHCLKASVQSPCPSECFNYLDYTQISWQWLVNLTKVRSHQRLLHHWNLSSEWIRGHLQIQEADTFTLRDSHPYHYRFLDNLTDVSPSNDKYMEDIDIPTLAHSSKRLIQVGTLFGSSRLHLKNVNNILIRDVIRQSMVFSNPHLGQAADLIEKSFGGPYLGAHVRLGDGHFMENREVNARLVWWKIVHKVLRFTAGDTSVLERTFVFNRPEPFRYVPDISADLATLEAPYHWVPPSLEQSTLNISCRGERHTISRLLLLNTPLFISTDIKDPHTDPSIQRFLRTFPCTFFLSDFPSELASLSRLKNGYDGVMLEKYLLPFLDAMVVGRGREVVGTEGSTFSRFVRDVLWKTYHSTD